mgnify:CR=1 FL=1
MLFRSQERPAEPSKIHSEDEAPPPVKKTEPALTPEQRRAEMKSWGAWPRIRAVAIPLARAEGLTPPANIEDLVNDHVLYTMVAKQMNKK